VPPARLRFALPTPPVASLSPAQTTLDATSFRSQRCPTNLLSQLPSAFRQTTRANAAPKRHSISIRMRRVRRKRQRLPSSLLIENASARHHPACRRGLSLGPRHFRSRLATTQPCNGNGAFQCLSWSSGLLGLQYAVTQALSWPAAIFQKSDFARRIPRWDCSYRA